MPGKGFERLELLSYEPWSLAQKQKTFKKRRIFPTSSSIYTSSI